MAEKNKFSILKNDRTTSKDEFILALIILAAAATGYAIFKTAPSFWIINSTVTKGFGLIWIMFAVMLFPTLVYRLATNGR